MRPGSREDFRQRVPAPARRRTDRRGHRRAGQFSCVSPQSLMYRSRTDQRRPTTGQRRPNTNTDQHKPQTNQNKPQQIWGSPNTPKALPGFAKILANFFPFPTNLFFEYGRRFLLYFLSRLQEFWRGSPARARFDSLGKGPGRHCKNIGEPR